MMLKLHRGIPSIVWIAVPWLAGAQTAPPKAPTQATAETPMAVEKEPDVETISIIGRPGGTSRVAGSAHRIDAAELARFNYDDVHRVLLQTPGVYVRGEDGYGLRPNIGMRGANSDRSSKVTLMEDGVLMAPAPYSAPAAYYFPLMPRIAGAEVFKGPASIRYGPNTIGGALNFQTRALPTQTEGYLDLGYGTDRFGRVHGHVGTGGERWSVLLEGVHFQTEGFKDLDGGDDTGFDRNEVVLRARYATPDSGDLKHQFAIRLGYADEASRETYLGLADQDFEATPFRRYPATQRGLMDWQRTQLRLTYTLSDDDAFDLRIVGYRHDFERSWEKINRFRGADIRDVLNNPDSGQEAVFFSILRGEEDSTNSDQALLIGTNSREFVSQGVEATARWNAQWGPLTNQLRLGARFHYDEIRRRHTEDAFLMDRGQLVPEGTDTEVTTRNRGSTDAWAFYLYDEIELGDLLVAPGVRLERITSVFRDNLARSRSNRSDTVLIPGVGVHYQLTPELGLWGGVHQGFSPVSPGQSDDVEPEKSVNYEAGARFGWRRTRAEVIGFFNDYANLTGECTQSSGCADALLNQQFNGGEVHVYGLEAVFGQEVQTTLGASLFANIAYTLTQSRFRSSFLSENNQFGEVNRGDELPYVPEHQGSLQTGVRGEMWEVNTSVTYVGTMRDAAGQGPIPIPERIDDYVVVDVATSVALGRVDLYVNVNNVFNTAYAVSRRPLGLRPGRPFQLLAGVRLDL